MGKFVKSKKFLPEFLSYWKTISEMKIKSINHSFNFGNCKPVYVFNKQEEKFERFSSITQAQRAFDAPPDKFERSFINASEIETQYLVDLINKNNFSAIITIHAPYKTVNYDGPAEILANKISTIVGYPPSSDIGYATPGSFGTYCGKERQIPTITIEIDEEEKMEPLNQKFHNLFEYLKNEY